MKSSSENVPGDGSSTGLMSGNFLFVPEIQCLSYLTTYNARSYISGRWQAPAAVLPEGPKDIGHGHSRARRAREWPKHASPRARRARGRAKLRVRFGACQCYYMFFTTQLKIANFMAKSMDFKIGEN